MKRVVRQILLMSIAVLLSGCGAQHEPSVMSIPETPLLTRGDEHLVVTALYARLRAEPRWDADILAIVRRGDVRAVEGRTPYEDVVFARRNVWYELSPADGDSSRPGGWLFGDRGVVHATESRARNAAGGLLR